MDNEIKFDPLTGQPINKKEPTGQELQAMSENQNVVSNNNNSETEKNQIDLQAIPNVNQSDEQFIKNVQATSKEKNDSSAEGINYAFIVILFIIIFASIFFLFPIINEYI